MRAVVGTAPRGFAGVRPERRAGLAHRSGRAWAQWGPGRALGRSHFRSAPFGRGGKPVSGCPGGAAVPFGHPARLRAETTCLCPGHPLTVLSGLSSPSIRILLTSPAQIRCAFVAAGPDRGPLPCPRPEHLRAGDSLPAPLPRPALTVPSALSSQVPSSPGRSRCAFGALWTQEGGPRHARGLNTPRTPPFHGPPPWCCRPRTGVTCA